MTTLGKCIQTRQVLSENAQTKYPDGDYLPIVGIQIRNRGISTSLLNAGVPARFCASTGLVKPMNGSVSHKFSLPVSP